MSSKIRKKDARNRRSKKFRSQIKSLEVNRLSVVKSAKHMYAQIFTSSGDKVLATASTLEKDLRGGVTGNIKAAEKVGALIAERALAAGLKKVSFDKSGYQYHGRVKALAESARTMGLDF